MPIFILLILYITSTLATPKLYDDEYWLKLLHFKEGKSQIDDANFFLSKEGKISAQKELEATLEALKNSDFRDINGTACRYPARTRWLKESLIEHKIEECSHLKNTLKKFHFKTLYLVYTSSFMNSPASMVGHTFLRFDRDENTPLLSYALNYSAQIDKKKVNILSYAYRGVFGGFEGRYRIVPYYEMVKLYSDMEHRDMWEYKLKLTPKEIERVVLHMFEMQPFYSDYFFTSENCSYNLLWFIEMAREELKLVDKFNYITAPMDSIKELEKQGLIERSIFRPSKTTKAKSLYEEIEHKEVAELFLDESNLTEIKKLPTSEQIDILSLYFLKGKEEDIADILSYRSQLGIKKDKKIEPTTNPIKSNRATKLTLSYRDNKPEFGIRASYHDIYDVDYDFNRGSYISFFDIKATTDRLNSFILLNIDSITEPHPLYNSYSWGIYVGFDREIDDKLRGNIRLKGGKSINLFSTLLYLEPAIEIREKFLSLGYNMGILKSFREIKVGLLFTENKREAFLTYQFEENIALHLSTLERKEETINQFGIFYFF